MIIHFRCCISHFRYDKTKRKRTAQDKWTEKYEWLHVEENIMFCKVCRAFPDLSDKTATLVKGVTNKGGVALRGVSWYRQNPFIFCVC